MDYSQPILAAWAASSQDATKVSRAITGGVVALSSVIVLVASMYLHIQLSANDVLQFASELGAVGGFIALVSGLILKVVHAVAKKDQVN